MPQGLRVDDLEAMKAWINTLPTSAFFMLVVAWGVGSFVGASAARWIARDRAAIPGLIVWGLLTAATVFNLLALPHPFWLWPAGVGACLLGGLLGMVAAAPRSYKVATSREIDSSISRVFKTLATIDEYSKAVPGISKIEFLSNCRSGVGTRFRETRWMNGRESTVVLEVTEFDADQRVRLISEAGGTIWDTVFTVAENDGKVLMNMRMEARPLSFLARIFTPLIIGVVASAVEKDMDSVKGYCESLPTSIT